MNKEKKLTGSQIGSKNQDLVKSTNNSQNYSNFRKPQKDVNERINDFFQQDINQVSKSTDSNKSQKLFNITQKDRLDLQKELKKKQKYLILPLNLIIGIKFLIRKKMKLLCQHIKIIQTQKKDRTLQKINQNNQIQNWVNYKKKSILIIGIQSRKNKEMIIMINQIKLNKKIQN
ncbi:hypothetical protein IMG5_092620 [Ichthyophthirius multifiliis]|uniref:Uncharacterized protein n=1 Tax=Ichthyophthirius multifiliis TaxID=5932 RepID=G0QRG0_ICHMU|nr:hypothetical protein IMG5_092620 [Ichthyophthirius multifiliis]EGR32195.1 hypothetical protein IMG5_092620 [Ichthyophthirius multifiliis]|eukprot:XP_004035681.1 hypothetical protein IMG5_092620 [Ichthyophthirius multifiliis]